jgi:hypothetical protein
MISFFSNEPDELKMQPTIHLEGKTGYLPRIIQLYVPNVLWVAFSILSGPLLLLNHLVVMKVLSKLCKQLTCEMNSILVLYYLVVDSTKSTSMSLLGVKET